MPDLNIFIFYQHFMKLRCVLKSEIRLAVASLTLSKLMLTDCELSLAPIDLIDPALTLAYVV